MRNSRQSFFYKIVFIVSSLCIFPVLLVGLISYTISTRVVNDNIALEKQHSIEQVQTNVEQTLRTIDHSLTQFSTSTRTIQTLKEPLTPNQFQLFNLISSDLIHLQTFDSQLADIVLVSLEQKWLINNYGLQRLTDEQISQLQEHYLSENTPSGWFLDKNDKKIYQETTNINPSTYSLITIKKLPITSSNKTGFVIAKIHVSNYEKILNQHNSMEDTVVLNNEGRVIMDSSLSKMGESLADLEDINQMIQSEKENGQFTTTIEDTPFLVTFKNSDYNDWTYISFVKLSEVKKQTMPIALLTLMTTLVIIIISFIFSILGSKKMYKPVKQLKETILDSSNALVNKENQNEIEFIENYIKTMLQRNDYLEETISNQINQLKHFFVQRLIDGMVSLEEFESRMSYYGYNQDYKQMFILAAQIDTLEGTGYKDKEEDVLLLIINNLIEEIVPAENRLTPIVKSHTQITVLLNNDKTKTEYEKFLESIANQVQSKVKEEYNISISIGISDPFTDIYDAREAYNQSLEALKYVIKFGPNSTIFFNKIDTVPRIYTHYPRNLVRELFDAIRINENEKVMKLLDEFFEEIFKEDLNWAQYQISLLRFLNDLIELMQTLAIDVLEHNGSQLLGEVIYNFKSKEEAKEWFKQTIIEPLLKEIESRSEEQYKNISENIVQIIHEEYDTDLTLDSIASKLHYNPNYLSSVFRKQMNISFSEYLAMYRIDMAKKLLLETEMSIKDISIKLNYKNPQNFIRSFKKFEGITPGKYRERVK